MAHSLSLLESAVSAAVLGMRFVEEVVVTQSVGVGGGGEREAKSRSNASLPYWYQYPDVTR
jgi:hypothetical protein